MTNHLSPSKINSNRCVMMSGAILLSLGLLLEPSWGFAPQSKSFTSTTSLSRPLLDSKLGRNGLVVDHPHFTTFNNNNNNNKLYPRANSPLFIATTAEDSKNGVAKEQLFESFGKGILRDYKMRLPFFKSDIKDGLNVQVN